MENTDILFIRSRDNTRSTQGYVLSRKGIYGGGYREKHELKVLLTDGRGQTSKRKLSLFEKVNPMNGVESNMEAWRRLKKAGIPTVSFMRSTEDSIIMPDLRALGYEFYGKGLNDNTLWRKYCIQDDHFLEITKNGTGEIKKEAERLAEIATQNGIELPRDDSFEMLIHEDGSWGLIVLDVEQCNFRRLANSSGLQVTNEVSRVNNFMMDIDELTIRVKEWKVSS